MHRVAAAVAGCSAAAVVWRRDDIRRVFSSWHMDMLHRAEWEQMPHRIIFLRHGQSEANVDSNILATRADNCVELTPLGRQQATAAGERLRQLLPADAKVQVVLSPFERAQQTLHCALRALGDEKVQEVHIDPRVREQEFGNLQNREERSRHRSLATQVGRFYFRRPEGESSADVFDRVSDFWDSLYSGYFIRRRFLQTSNMPEPPDAVLVVTHGLTMRLIMMRYFGWSVDTFETVYNPDNCDMWVLRKHRDRRVYEFCAEESWPPRVPWATRQVRVVRSDGEGGHVPTDYTILDYLSIPVPRSSHPEAALKLLLPGHGHNLDPGRHVKDSESRVRWIEETLARVTPLNVSEVEYIDWWSGKVSPEGVACRSNIKHGGGGVVHGSYVSRF